MFRFFHSHLKKEYSYFTKYLIFQFMEIKHNSSKGVVNLKEILKILNFYHHPNEVHIVPQDISISFIEQKYYSKK